jgi:hypothetical protein
MDAGWLFAPQKWRLAVAVAVENSFQPNPDWVRRVRAVQTLMRNEVQEKIQQGFQQIEAAHQIMEEVMANEAACDKQKLRQHQRPELQPERRQPGQLALMPESK